LLGRHRLGKTRKKKPDLRLGRNLSAQHGPNGRAANMDTFLLTTQIVCYGLSIVSTSVNIASFVRRRRTKLKRRFRVAGAPVPG
jgi:hypothetical protein